MLLCILQLHLATYLLPFLLQYLLVDWVVLHLFFLRRGLTLGRHKGDWPRQRRLASRLLVLIRELLLILHVWLVLLALLVERRILVCWLGQFRRHRSRRHCHEVLLDRCELWPEGVRHSVVRLRRCLDGCLLVRLPLGVCSWR